MNHRALQRALVVALHDPDVTDATFAALGVGEAERAELARVDRRALKTDPLRRRRLLRTLAEEYKATTTLLLAETRSLAGVDAFFTSATFRSAIMNDGALALAFGAFLGELAAGARTPQLGGVLRLEATRAAGRRCARAIARPGVALAPGVAVVALDASVLPAVQAVERYLFEVGLMPQVALCDDAPRLPPLGPLAATEEHYLLQPAGEDIAVAPIDADLFRVLAGIGAAGGVSRREAAAVLTKAGVPAARATDLLDSLLMEGLLAEGPAREGRIA